MVCQGLVYKKHLGKAYEDIEMEYFLKQIDRLIEDMQGDIPASQTTAYIYGKSNGTEWTDGFWAGMLNLAYEYTKDEKYKREALKQVDLLYDRIVNKIGVNHHDMGFLYSPSCLAAYELYGSEKALEAAIMAADNLMMRFREKGNFIQAWGNIDNNPNSYRLIIDCLLNLPLLYKVSEITGKSVYREIAKKHFDTASKLVIREDYSTNHTFFFDIKTGKPKKASTVQGYSDNSIWARGQAWAVYGLPLNYKYLKDADILEKYIGVTEVFFKQLPKDLIPYWDMIFTEGDEPRDTSAAGIAVCGILEMDKYFPNPEYHAKALAVLEALMKERTTKDIAGSNGVIKDSMYNRKVGHQPECSIWGDYFAMEALYRSLKPDWKPYW